MGRCQRGRRGAGAPNRGGAALTAFRERVAALTGAPPERLERLAGGDLSEALLVAAPDGRRLVAKRGMASLEAGMLRAIAQAGVPAPRVEGEFDDLLLLEYVEHDEAFSPRAWAAIGAALRRLHDQVGDSYGWPSDFAIGSVEFVNAQRADWAAFWTEHRLLSPAAVLDRPWRERVHAAAERATPLLTHAPPMALLHGHLWTGNILVRQGDLAAFIDPACYHGDPEVDLAMLTLFDTPQPEFWSAYGALAPGWEARRPVYQLFAAVVHVRLHGPGYLAMLDRTLGESGA